MIDFEVSRRPGRPSEWIALIDAIRASKEPVESYWLELKSTVNWSTGGGVGNLARAILGMANRDPARAAPFMGGSGLVIVGLGDNDKTMRSVEVLDPADLENKLAPYIGAGDGPRWQAHWPTVDGASILIVEVEPPRAGDPGYTLRKGYGEFKMSQTFVREQGKTSPATQSEVERLARRMFAATTTERLDVIVGYSLDEPLCRINIDRNRLEAFLDSERSRLLRSLDRATAAAASNGSTVEREANRYGSLIAPLAGLLNLEEKQPEDRSTEQYRAEVEAWVRDARERAGNALDVIAQRTVPVPRFWLSNLSARNFTAVEVTLQIDGARGVDSDEGDETSLSRLLPKRPREFGPYTKGSGLSILLEPVGRDLFPAVALGPGRRDHTNTGRTLTVELDRADLRPGDAEVPLESELAILVSSSRPEPVVVRWRATASNVDAIAEGEFELPFEGEPLDLVWLGLDMYADPREDGD